MKSSSLIRLLLVVAPTAARVLAPRQGHSHGGGGGKQGGAGSLGQAGMYWELAASIPDMMAIFNGQAAQKFPTQKAYKIEQIPSLRRKDAKRIKITYGPYALRPANNGTKIGNSFSLDPAGTGYMNVAAQDFPKDVTILDAITGVFDDEMKEIDFNKGLYNHHNVFFDLGASFPMPLSCGPSFFDSANFKMPVNIFMGGAADTTSNHYTSQDGQFNSGYYLGNNSDVLEMIDIVNYNNKTVNVFTISELEYVPGKPAGLLPANSVSVALGMCDGWSGMNLLKPMVDGQTADGKKKFSIAGKDVVVARDGYFLNWHGHMHDGGVAMSTLLNGKEVCKSKALYGGPGHEGTSEKGEKWTTINSMEFCEEPVKVSKGDKLTVSADFDMIAHPQREQVNGGMGEVMAIMVATFADSKL